MPIKRVLLLLLGVSAFISSGFAEDRANAVSRLQSAGTILDEIMAAPDKGLPQEILGGAECVAIVPSLLKAGFVIGGTYGRGVATCRTASGWSAPAFFRLEGGSFGLQIGGQAVDLIMVVMNESGMKHLLSSHFKLGADASVAAGPVGRHAEGMTDLKMRAEVLTYSRARGVFAGVSVNGAGIQQDKGSTRAFYGRMLPFNTVLGGETALPAEAHPFVSTVAKYAGAAKQPDKRTEVQPTAKPAEAAPSQPASPQPQQNRTHRNQAETRLQQHQRAINQRSRKLPAYTWIVGCEEAGVRSSCVRRVTFRKRYQIISKLIARSSTLET